MEDRIDMKRAIQEEVGGFEKNHRTKRRREERPGKNKTPRPKEARLIIPKEPVAVKPPEEKKEVMIEMENDVPASQTRPEFGICAVCGQFSRVLKDGTGRKQHFLVCKGCDNKYSLHIKAVADKIMAGENLSSMTKIEWVLSQLDIPRFEEELDKARQNRGNLEERILQRVAVKTDGKKLPKELWNELHERIQKEIRSEDHFLVQRFYARLQAAQKLKSELEERLANEAAEKLVTCNPPLAPAEVTVPTEAVVA